jgi:hypothetical protein
MWRAMRRWPRTLRDPSAALLNESAALEPHANFVIADRPVQFTGKLSADTLDVDSDGVQMHYFQTSMQATETREQWPLGQVRSPNLPH